MIGVAWGIWVGKTNCGKNRGVFWPKVRVLIWERAQELYQHDEARGSSGDLSGVTATRKELVEGGYFQTAKVIVLRELKLQSKGSIPPYEEGSQGSGFNFPEEE